MAKCEAVAGSAVIDGVERTISCALDAGHLKPYHPECSCERHDVEWWSQGKPHEMRIAWGTPDPKPTDPDDEKGGE